MRILELTVVSVWKGNPTRCTSQWSSRETSRTHTCSWFLNGDVFTNAQGTASSRPNVDWLRMELDIDGNRNLTQLIDAAKAGDVEEVKNAVSTFGIFVLLDPDTVP